MQQKKILIPIGQCARDLKSVHYALALAERIQAQIYILQQTMAPSFENPHSMWLDEALLDLINNARQAGIVVSHYIASKKLDEEIVDLVRAEHIDLLVFSTDEEVSERLVRQVKPLVPSQIIQVREKDNMKYPQEGQIHYGTCNDLKHVPGRSGGVGTGAGPQDKLVCAQPRGTSGTGKATGH